MKINKYESHLLLSNMYIIEQNGHAIVIDPFEVSIFDGDIIIDYIILTHEHYDHISGVNYWKSLYDVPVLCSKRCSKLIQDSQENMAKYFKQFCKYQTWVEIDELPETDKNYVCSADNVFEDQYEFKWEGHVFNLFELPGHSMGSIGIMLDDKHFFSGDSLIEGINVEESIPIGGKEKWKSITEPRLNALPDGIIVHPGHFNEFIYNKNKKKNST